MKKIISAAFAIVLAASLVSCGSSGSKTSSENDEVTTATEEKIDFKAAYDAGLASWGTDSEDLYKLWVSYDESSLTISECGTMYITSVAEPIFKYFDATSTWEKVKNSSVADGQQEDTVNGVKIWWKINMPQNDFSQKTVTVIFTAVQ